MGSNLNTFLLLVIITVIVLAIYYAIPVYNDYLYYKPIIDDIIVNIQDTQFKIDQTRNMLENYISELEIPMPTL